MTYEYASGKFDEKLSVDFIFLDYKIAFDKVNHYILFSKLMGLGIEGNALHRIFQFFTNRKIIVRTASKMSSLLKVSSGVPKGTCLGQIIVLIFINHVCSEVKSFLKIFADGMKIRVRFDSATGENISNALHCEKDLFEVPN